MAGSRSGRVYLLRSDDGQQADAFPAGAAVQAVAFNRDESKILCGLIDGRIAEIDPGPGRAIAKVAAHSDQIHAVAVHPAPGIVATASRDKTVGLWRLDGSTPIELVRIPSPSGRPVLSVRFSPDGRSLGMLVQNERAVRVWDLDLLRKRLASLGLDWE